MKSAMIVPLPPKLQNLPASLPIDGAVRIELEDGVPIFRASSFVQTRIATLLLKQQTSVLNPDEEQELDRYEEIDDYLILRQTNVRIYMLSVI